VYKNGWFLSWSRNSPFLWNPKTHCSTHERPSLYLILSHFRPFHILATNSSALRFNIILPSTRRCLKSPLSLRFSGQNFVRIFRLMRAVSSAHRTFLHFNRCNSSCRVQIVKHFIMLFFSVCLLTLVRSEYFRVFLRQSETKFYSHTSANKITRLFLVYNNKDTEKTKCMITSSHPNSGQNQKIRAANGSFQNVAKFKYLGTSLTNQNDIHDEIKSRLNSGNFCYCSVPNIFCFLVSYQKT
jgi:hypothetical protein